MEYKLSGYTTTRNCVELDYPFRESIKNLLSFCDEVIVGDSSDKNDGTSDVLEELLKEHDNLYVFHVDVDWNAPNHGIYDGQMKAVARSKCTGDFCWQQDVDEVTEEAPREKIDQLLEQASEHMDDAPIIALPLVEYWGSGGKVRVDVNPWKWRLSKNLPNITHGIPAHLRRYENGLLYAKAGDGCEYIDANTGKMIQFSNFVNDDVENLRQQAITDVEAARKYQNWYNMIIGHLPTVYHFSWWSIATKIKRFRDFWNSSWLSLYGQKKEEGYNPFFADKSLEEVTDEEIEELSRKLESETGGHIFHQPWNGEKTNHVHIEKPIPEIMKQWCEDHPV